MASKDYTRKNLPHARLFKRIAPPLTFVLALCALVVCCYDPGYSAFPPTEKRYAKAKADIASLRRDAGKNTLREPWEKLAAEFRSIYDNDAAWPNRPAALFRAAESLEELAKRSFVRKDALQAAECYEMLSQRHPESRLADDALYRAAKIRAAWLKDDNGALVLLAKIKKQYPKGDMLPEALTLEKALRASASGRTAPEARQIARTPRRDAQEDAPVNDDGRGKSEADLRARYQAAKLRMEKLGSDPVRACWRQPWEDLREEFSFIHVNSTGNRAMSSGALYRAALSREALADCSRLESEYRAAHVLYLSLPQKFPQSALADDALLRAAHIAAGRLAKKDEGLALLPRLVSDYPPGDMVGRAREMIGLWSGPVADAAGTTAPAPPKKTRDAGKPSPSASPEIRVLSWNSPDKDSVAIVLELSAPARYNTRLVRSAKGKAASIYLDIEKADVVEAVRKGVRVKGSLLTTVSVQNGKKGGATLQFDFREVRRFDAHTEDNPCRIILDVAAGKTPLPRKSGVTSGFADAAPSPVADKAAWRQVNDMASQLGLTVQTVFIDAGHGGRDPGTAHNNVIERAVTLDVAKTLGRLLSANGVDVVFSRSRDKFVGLSERTARANAARADLFISIHVNANTDARVNGLETYYLDLARTPQAAKVAALENAGSDRRLGDMQNMLADVMLNARIGESRRLAGDIQQKALSRLKKRNFATRSNGVKSAPFHVLIGAQMPAILVELGYCTNVDEAARLADAKYRYALAEGLAEGILAYRNRLLQRNTAENSLTNPAPGAI